MLDERSKTGRREKEREGDFAMLVLRSGVAERPTLDSCSRPVPTLGDLGIVEGLPDSNFGRIAPKNLETSDLAGKDNCSCEVAIPGLRITSTLEMTTDI